MEPVRKSTFSLLLHAICQQQGNQAKLCFYQIWRCLGHAHTWKGGKHCTGPSALPPRLVPLHLPDITNHFGRIYLLECNFL